MAWKNNISNYVKILLFSRLLAVLKFIILNYSSIFKKIPVVSALNKSQDWGLMAKANGFRWLRSSILSKSKRILTFNLLYSATPKISQIEKLKPKIQNIKFELIKSKPEPSYSASIIGTQLCE